MHQSNNTPAPLPFYILGMNMVLNDHFSRLFCRNTAVFTSGLGSINWFQLTGHYKWMDPWNIIIHFDFEWKRKRKHKNHYTVIKHGKYVFTHSIQSHKIRKYKNNWMKKARFEDINYIKVSRSNTVVMVTIDLNDDSFGRLGERLKTNWSVF